MVLKISTKKWCLKISTNGPLGGGPSLKVGINAVMAWAFGELVELASNGTEPLDVAACGRLLCGIPNCEPY